MTTRTFRASVAVLVSALCITASATPAQAADRCAGATQWSGPVLAEVTVCIDDVTSNYVTAGGYVLGTSGGARVTDCVAYTKVWHNHTLVANSVRRGSDDCSTDAEGPWYGKSAGRPARGTVITAQTWLDVRYALNGRTAVTRLASPRAVMTWWP